MAPARPPLHDPREIYGIVSADARHPTDNREVIARLVGDTHIEVVPERAKEGRPLPIVIGLTATAVEGMDEKLRVTLISLGANRRQLFLGALWEARHAILAGAIAAYGRNRRGVRRARSCWG